MQNRNLSVPLHPIRLCRQFAFEFGNCGKNYLSCLYKSKSESRSWNKASASFENQLSQEASDTEKARKIWEISEKLVGFA